MPDTKPFDRLGDKAGLLTGMVIQDFVNNMFYRWDSAQNGFVQIAGPVGGAVWGSVTGALVNQTDVQSALDMKLSRSGGTMTGNLNLTPPIQRGVQREVWLASDRLDGAAGDGSKDNPLDASTAIKMTDIMRAIPQDSLIVFCGGVFESFWWSQAPHVPRNGYGWSLKSGWKLEGQGISELKLAAVPLNDRYWQISCDGVSGESDISLNGFTINSNLTGQTVPKITCSAIYVIGHRGAITNCKIKGYGQRSRLTDEGGVIENFVLTAGGLTTTEDCVIEGNHIFERDPADEDNYNTLITLGGYIQAGINGNSIDLPGYSCRGKIRNNVLKQTLFGSIGIQCNATISALIEGNFVENCGAGIWQDTEPNYYQVIRNNTIKNCGAGVSIQATNAGGSVSRYCTVENNVIWTPENTFPGAFGIKINTFTGSHLLVRGNRISPLLHLETDYYQRFDTGGISVSGVAGVTVIDNYVDVGDGGGYRGIDISGCTQVFSHGNTNNTGRALSGNTKAHFPGVLTAAYQALFDGVLLTDTTAGGFVVTLPQVGAESNDPLSGAGREIEIVDTKGTWATAGKNLTVTTYFGTLGYAPLVAIAGTVGGVGYSIALGAGAYAAAKSVRFIYSGASATGWTAVVAT